MGLESQQANFCIDGNFPSNAFTAFRAAVTDWNNNTGFRVPAGVPLVENCNWQVGFRPGYWPGYPTPACLTSPAVACVALDWSYQRGGAYVAAAHIWLDTRLSWTSTGYRAVAAHELGHVFGLDEQYINDGSAPLYTCNNSIVSIMDTAYNWGHCDGIVGPTSLDWSRANDWYTIRPATSPSLTRSGRTLNWSFEDRNYTEAHYQEKIQRWRDGPGWLSYTEKNKVNDVAPCDEHQLCRLYDSYTVGLSGTYRVCIIPHNGVFGPRPETCTASVYVP